MCAVSQQERSEQATSTPRKTIGNQNCDLGTNHISNQGTRCGKCHKNCTRKTHIGRAKRRVA
jgi:hypothetical protein